jgi:hypothetical protein
MGVDYNAAIMIGLPRGELSHLQDLEDMLDEEELEVCAPYYDGDSDDNAIVGFPYQVSGTYRPSTMEWDQAEVDKQKARFKRVTGREAKVWLSPMGW